MADGKTKAGPQTGVGVDSGGWPVQDPTANVLAIVQAAVQRQDDLRAMSTAHTAEIGNIRESYARDLREAEAARIDAIRTVDVQAVQRAAEVQLAQATALATQVSVSAETLRTQVAATAAAAATSLAAALVPIQEAIADLRRAQYEQQGQKTQVADTRGSSTFARQGLAVAISAGSFLLAIILAVALFLK